MPFDCDESVAIAKVLVFVGPNALFLLADKRPHLVHFDITYLDVADSLSHDAFAFLTGQNQQLQDGSVMNARHALKGSFVEDFGIDVDCYVLNDEARTAVISQRGMGEALGRMGEILTAQKRRMPDVGAPGIQKDKVRLSNLQTDVTN